MKPDLLEYIRANRGTYTREAIRRELLDAGHEVAAIDAAWEEVEAENPAPPTVERVFSTGRFWVAAILTAILALTILPFVSFFVVAAAAGIVSSSVGSGAAPGWLNSGLAFVVGIIAPLVLGYLGIGLGGWWLLRRDRALAIGIFSGLTVAFALSVVVAGICVAILTSL